MDDFHRYSPPQSSMYITIAMYAAANALSLSVFLILYHVSAVLADFRDAMLYAFLCSIALRGPKDWLVERMDWHLGQDHSLVVTVLAALVQPISAVKLLYGEGKDLVRAFQAKLKEVKAEMQRKVRKICIFLCRWLLLICINLAICEHLELSLKKKNSGIYTIMLICIN